MTGAYVAGEVDAWIGHQVGLEFCQINIQGSRTSLEVQWSRLSASMTAGMGSIPDQGIKITVTYQSVQVSTCWLLNIKVSKTDVIGALIVYHETTIRVL